jgi:hypothetical protein
MDSGGVVHGRNPYAEIRESRAIKMDGEGFIYGIAARGTIIEISPLHSLVDGNESHPEPIFQNSKAGSNQIAARGLLIHQAEEPRWLSVSAC